MDLTNVLPADLIEVASGVNARPAILARPGLDPVEYLAIASLAVMLKGGAKIIKPSDEICERLKDAHLRFGIDEYAQPYAGTGVVLPGSLFGASRDRLATSIWEPGHPPCILFFGELRPHAEEINMTPLRIDPPPGVTIEEFITSGECDEELVPIARVVMNLCRLAVERGVRVLPLDPRAEKRRRKARDDERIARLAARDAQEVIIQDLGLILLPPASPEGEGVGPDGWRQRMHRRRGHWKMQAYGPGGSLRKRIYVQEYMVHPDDNPDGEVQSILS